MREFFISYSRADRLWAEWIAWHLEEANYSTRLQAWDFRPGGNFVLEMQRATTEAQRTIAVLSPDYLTADFVHSEWAAAFAADPKGEKRILVPVRVRECAAQGLLSTIVYLDLVGLDEVTAKAALLSMARDTRGKPAVAPVFPGDEIAKPRIYPGGNDVQTSLFRNLAVLRPDTPPHAVHAMHKAAQALSDQINPTVSAEFLQELSNRYRDIEDPTTRFWIAQAIGKFGTVQAKEALEQLFSVDDHPYVLYGLRQALDMVAKENLESDRGKVSKPENE